MEKTIPDVLYHYCSLDTFYNIMKNHSIWLSDVTRSNDSKELVWAIEEFTSCFEEQVKSYALLKSIDLREIQETLHIIEETRQYKYQDLLKSWVFCLSEKEDNLGQWRGYADDGKGISIGFKFDYLCKIKKYLEMQPANTRSFFEKVHYDLPKDQVIKAIGFSGLFESDNLDDSFYLKFSASFTELLKKVFCIRARPLKKNANGVLAVIVLYTRFHQIFLISKRMMFSQQNLVFFLAIIL